MIRVLKRISTRGRARGIYVIAMEAAQMERRIIMLMKRLQKEKPKTVIKKRTQL